MLDSDLARLYKCTNGTKQLNLAVKRNIERFPNDFMFKLTNEESNYIYSLRFQIETIKNDNDLRGYHVKYNYYAFTEGGISMLASVLHSDIVVQISIKIIKNLLEDIK